MKVCIDARIVPGAMGGVEQFIIGVLAGLSALEDGGEEYCVLTNPAAHEALKPFMRREFTVLYERSEPAARTTARRVIDALGPVGEGVKALRRRVLRKPALASSSGVIEAAGVDVMHFTWQDAFVTEIPSIYHPHDLQHCHYPEYFDDATLRRRTYTYTEFSRRAARVAVAASWGRDDLVRHLGLPPEQVAVVALAPLLDLYPDPGADGKRRVREALSLPERFVFYPATTWPHKNHINLVRALRAVRDAHGAEIPLICSGGQSPHAAEIRRVMAETGTEAQVRFVGYLDDTDLRAVYQLATAVAVPTRFEAVSFPVWEAFSAGAPVACSNVTGLPAQTAGAALLFDPEDVPAMADALWRLWSDDVLRARLAAQGREVVAAFTWPRTARHYRALYRRIGGVGLTDEDRTLLQAPPLV